MIELKYSHLNSFDFMGAVDKIDNTPAQKISAKTLFDFNKIKNRLDAEQKRAKDCYSKLLEKHAEWEEVKTKDGKPLLGPGNKPIRKLVKEESGEPVYKSKEAFLIDYKLMMEEKFEIKSAKLVAEDLINCGLTPKELRTVEPLTENPKEIGE